MIQYQDTLEGISESQLAGFFVGWPNPPSPATHLRLLRGSDHVGLAQDGAGGRVVGFITAISDGVLNAYIPLLEVLPEYQGRGIGTELTRRMLRRLERLYSVDLLCDPDLQIYYSRFQMQPVVGMMLRQFQYQAGSTLEPTAHPSAAAPAAMSVAAPKPVAVVSPPPPPETLWEHAKRSARGKVQDWMKRLREK